MGTEIAISFSTLRAQLESEKSSLCKIDENIKKIVQTSGRFSDRFNGPVDYTRGGSRVGGRNAYPDVANNYKNEDQSKRKHETKTVFSRLSARLNDSDGEDDGPGPKRNKVPSTVCRELPTRAAVLRAQGDDEQARKRNRRIFGSLLGTLQKFKQEEIVMQTKEDKRAQVEKKIEEQARLEKERELQERKTLFAERDHKKATIKALEAKMARVHEFEKWEASQQCLSNFILTRTKPHIYWLPKKISEKATEKLNYSRKFHESYMARKREELQDELQRIEYRCLRTRGPGTKENNLENHHRNYIFEKSPIIEEIKQEDRGRKRDKFAMDVDEKDRDESDGEDRHTEIQENVTEKIESDENKMDTSSVQDNISQTNEEATIKEDEDKSTTINEGDEMKDLTSHPPEP